MTIKTNNGIKRSSIKSIIFSGLLAFGFMGIDNAFCANNANKAPSNNTDNTIKALDGIVHYYHKLYSPTLVKNLKGNIATILNTKIGDESLFDLLIRCQKTKPYDQSIYDSAGQKIKLAFEKNTISYALKNAIYEVTYGESDHTGNNIITFTPKSESLKGFRFEITNFHGSDRCIITIYCRNTKEKDAILLRCAVFKQKNGEYKLHYHPAY